MNRVPPPTTMKPEGSRKVVVMNGSRQLNQMLGGEWVTLKVLPHGGLPTGVYQLADAQKPPVSGKPAIYTGQLLQVDDHKVYQLHGKNVIQHDRSVFHEAESKGDKLIVGRTVSVAYQNGRGAVVTGEHGAARNAPVRSKGKDGGVEI
ncbi:conjugal transfer protein TraB [Salmonella enterica]|nr:conjugal transfer protein TraB [Salmonella enterica]